MHQIFKHRDYLDEIFSCLSDRDLAATICVNKTWFEASVFPLWKIIDLSVALKLLIPARQIHKGIFKLPDLTCVDNWKRFMIYAQHVRVLHAHGTDSLTLATAIISKPPSLKNELKYFFPGCRFLNWHTTTAQVKATMLEVLLPPSVDHIVLTGGAIDPNWFDKFCQLMSSSLPSLSVFRVDYDGFIAPLQCSDSFLSLLTTFSSTLTYVWIPERLFTDVTLAKLLECDLHHLMVTRSSSIGLEEPLGFIQERADPKGPKRFSSLKSLIFGPFTSKSLALRMIRFPLPALTKFHWSIYNVDFDFDVFAMAISSVAPNLEILILGVFCSVKDMEVSWISVRRLLNCVKLTSLSIHCARVDMTLDNLVQLLRSRQGPLSWHVLEITSTQPLHFQDALLSVAKYSPKIHLLGLSVHDKNYANLFNEIPELSSQLIPRHAKKNNIRTQLKLVDQLKKSGFSLSSLSSLRLHDSVCSLESIGPIAFLILAICDAMKMKRLVVDDLGLEYRIRCRMKKYYYAILNLTD